MQWQCGRFVLDLSEPKIMGVLNCTPDSFSDGGKYIHIDKALMRAEEMISQGADIIDIGAESTRPGSKAVSIEEEISRLLPVVRELVARKDVPISIDTKNTKTIQTMLEIGVDIINDVNGLEDIGAIERVSKTNCGICIMHMRGMPENMQNNTNYQDVILEIDEYLQQRVDLCRREGIKKERIVIDPGFGFGKTPEQNIQLITEQSKFLSGEYPILLGVSRKSTIGYLLGNKPIEDRLIGSVVLGALSVYLGVKIIRVHDILETSDALKIVKLLIKPK
ncbi:dihydropteroate synthase [Suttonella ornithocola]|uniref:Dihydropteroate synthase n=1 Tax=Suttonella ornithocola TaxID=279832 RepID=A0A380MT97_9GAMM|nr:dihydropteroate synthase [Suttonella ornithocola]SUO94941.1 Dihydropteroate synthase [Suttonella ornithocola]